MLLSIADVSYQLRVSRERVKQFLRQGDLPVVKIGRRTLIDPADLARFIEVRRQRGAREPRPTVFPR